MSGVYLFRIGLQFPLLLQNDANRSCNFGQTIPQLAETGRRISELFVCQGFDSVQALERLPDILVEPDIVRLWRLIYRGIGFFRREFALLERLPSAVRLASLPSDSVCVGTVLESV